MALGIEVNNIAPGLIERAGVDLSENIRALGKQVQMHIYENQTRKDLAAMAQQIQGLDVKSAELPEQLMQLSFQHPMATSDPRGQMAIKMLANANEKWIASQNRVSGIYGYAPQVGIYNKETGDVTTPYTPNPRPTSPKGYSGVPGGILNRDTGEVEPLPFAAKSKTGGPTDYQRRNFAIQGVKNQRERIQSEIAPLEKRYNALVKEQGELEGDKANREVNSPRLQQIYNDLKSVGSKLEELGRKRGEIDQKIDQVYSEAALPNPNQPSMGDASLGGIVPESLNGAPTDQDAALLSPIPTAEATVKIKRDPKTGKRYEVDITTNKIVREVP